MPTMVMSQLPKSSGNARKRQKNKNDHIVVSISEDFESNNIKINPFRQSATCTLELQRKSSPSMFEK